MKKLLSLALALIMLLSVVPSLAEAMPTEEPAKGLPQVGDVVCGFEVLEIREFPLIGADCVLFEHQKTGAKLMYIANEDTNRVFDLTFLTRPTDNTGLPHVFEHSTLDGSEKYPSKALFFNLSYQTYNTYMNASTYSIMTTYPIASLSEAQLLKYADYYTDSCLNPTIMEDESIYREEAWRYRMASMEDDLTIEGTVYSEMLGATTLARAASFNAYRAAFPGSVVGLDQGGDPASIPDMTWDSLKEYHNLFYHPSNCIAFLYGAFEDYTAFLQLLDEYFAPYEKEEFVFVDSGYTPITGPVEEKLGFPMEVGSSTENQTTVYYYLLTPGLRNDPNEEMILNTLTDLMASASSPMMQSLRRALPTGSFSTYIDTTAPDDAIVFRASNVNEDDAALFKATVDAGLQEIAENGFAQDMVDGLMASLSLDIKLTAESSTIGVDVIPSLAYDYAATGNAFGYMEYVDALSKLDEWNQQGLYKEAVAKWLVGNELTALVTTYPEPGKKEENDAALAAALAEIKAGMTEDELQAIIDATNAVAEEEDTSAYVAQIQAVTVESLPEEMKMYTVYDETGDDTVRRVDAVAGVDGIGRVNLYLDAQGLPQEAIHWVKLFTSLIGQLDTDQHTKEELDVLVSRYLYNCGINISLFGEGEDFMPKFRMGWTSTDEDLAAGYDLMYELVYQTQFTDTQKLLDRVQALKASLRNTINGSAYNILLYRALAVTSPLYRYYNYMNYLDYYSFLEQVEAALYDMPEVVVQSLQAAQEIVKNSTNAIAAFAGNEDSISLNRPLADAFLAKLNQEPIERVEYDLPVPARHEALIVDVNVQFNALIADYASLDMEEFEGSLDALSALVQDIFLVPLLRDQYGVYAPWTGAVASEDGGVYLLTYRDPNIDETFAVYEALPELIAALDVDQETLDGYILSSYSGYALSSGELSGALDAMVAAIDGEPQDKALEYMRQLKALTPESMAACAEMYQKLVENGIRSTAGSASMINAHADLYDVILNPFNAQDASAVEFVDVPEDNEYYEAVRFAFENALMAAQTDDTFGVDDPATVGDLMAAIYSYMGGAPNSPVDARDWLAGHGLVEEDLDVETELTEEFLCFIMQNGLGVGLSTDTPETVVTRGDLADLLLMVFGD